MPQSPRPKSQPRRLSFNELKLATIEAASAEYPKLHFQEVKRPLPKGDVRQSVYTANSFEDGSVTITVAEDKKTHRTVTVEAEDTILIPGDMRRETPGQIFPIETKIRGYLISDGHLEIDKADVEEVEEMNEKTVAILNIASKPIANSFVAKSSVELSKTQAVINKASENIKRRIQKPAIP